MPFVANDIDDEDKKTAQGAVSPVPAGGAVHLAPSSGVGSLSGGSTGGPQKDAGGQFATLDKYITANQGQAAPLANKITGNIDKQYGELDQANQGVLQGIAGQVTSAPGYTKGDNDLIAKESADPVSFTGDQNNVAAFQKQLTNSYGGPTSAEGTNDFQAQQAKLNNAISQGQAQTSTSAGRKQLIQQNSALPTAGVTALNSAILSENPDYLKQVQDSYKPFQNLVSGLGTGAQDINKTIAQEQADAAGSSQAARGAVTGQMTGLNTAIQNQLTAQQKAATDQNAAVKQDLTSGKITPQDLQTLGISQEQWDSLSAAQKAAATSELVKSGPGQFQANSGTANVDLSQWLTQQDPNAVFNSGNVATADQYKKAQAFQTLLNGLNLDAPTLSINPADASKAGTAPTNLNSYDYKTALEGTQGVKTAEQTAAQAYVDALQSGADEEHAQLAAANAQKNQTMLNVAGLAQLPIAASTPVAQGAIQTAKDTASSPIRIAANILTGGAAGASEAAINTVSSAANTVVNMFCFHPWTLVEMADGTTKPIWDIGIGDMTRGGKVLAITSGVGTKFYWYEGVLLTPKHAVKEDGVWVRVENAKKARHFPYLTEVVCNLVTEQHRIWSNGVEFADFYETDLYEFLDLDESLAEMNRHESVC